MIDALLTLALLGVDATSIPPAEDAENYVASSTGTPNDTPWWLRFDDDELATVINIGLANNYDVRTAAARIVQAEAQAMRSLAPLLPSITADGTVSVGPFESLGFQFGGGLGGDGVGDTPSVFYNGSALLNARWQLDIWGQSYLAYRAASLQQDASSGDRESVALALTVQIATAYFDVVFNKEAIILVEEQIDANRRLLELLELRFERSESSGLDVLQQKQQLAARASELPPLRSQLRIAEQRLAILLGGPPRSAAPATVSSLPPLPPRPELGQPVDLLDHRPDLRALAQRWEASSKQSSSALRVHLPTLSVDGNAGWQFIRTIETDVQSVWGAGVTLSLPIFSGFNDVGQVREARASESVALETLNQGFLQAVNEVENAVVTEDETLAQLDLLEEQSEAANAAKRESEARYIAGLSNYIDVLTALTAAQTADRSVLQAERSLITARLQLYESLGGSWTRSALADSDGGSR